MSTHAFCVNVSFAIPYFHVCMLVWEDVLGLRPGVGVLVCVWSVVMVVEVISLCVYVCVLI